MLNLIKWIALCVMFAFIAIFLYITIDSKWAERNNAGIWITIAFFLAAGATIVSVFNAIESHDATSKE